MKILNFNDFLNSKDCTNIWITSEEEVLKNRSKIKHFKIVNLGEVEQVGDIHDGLDDMDDIISTF